VDLHSQSLNVIGPVGAAGKVTQVELDLVPAFVETHGHGTNKRLDARRRLVVRGTEAAAHVLVIQDLHLESEVLLKVLDDHDKKRQLDAEGLLRVSRTRDEVGAHVGAHDFEDRRLNVLVRDPLDVTIADLFVPDLQRLRPDGVEDGQESRLEGVLEHGCLKCTDKMSI